MKRKRNDKRTIFTIIIVLCLIFIFFVWRSFNAETGSRHLTFVKNWIEHFRKWLDVSGWTKLVYKIWYDKYEEVYEWAELENIKRTIEKIILKNIDNRISGLWVSDYKAYIENMDWNPYVVVEIGWIADLDEAKEIIWKTVELEFRLPNTNEPTAESIANRKQMAIDLRSEIIASSWNMAKLSDARWSENIFYTHVTWITLSEMPEIIKANPSALNIAQWDISDILEWLYETTSYQDLSGLIQSESYTWYTFFRVNDKQQVNIENASANDIVNAIEELWWKYDTRNTTESNLKVWEYEYQWNELVYNLWEVAEWSKLYDVKIVQVATATTELWASEEDTTKVNEENKAKIDAIVDSIKTSDDFGEDATLLIDDRWDATQIDSLISDFDDSKVWEVSTYTSLWTTYVVYLRNVKWEKDHMYTELVVNNIDKAAFESALESKVVYDMEIVFVQDRETWVTAKSSNWDILNWAYFKYAAVSQWQMWEPVVAINFDDQGKQVFCDITAENIGTQMAIFVWWVQLSAPVIQAKICGWTAQIDGSFTSATAKELVDNLNNWALPATLILMQEDKVSPTLWDSALQWALIAALIGIIAIYIYIFMMYWWKKANVTWLVLLSFIVVLAWFMKLVDYALSLSWIAAVILSIWMAVDSNILIYEREKEETKNWRSIHSAIDTAYDRSRPAIRDWNISTWLIALLLFMLGSNMFKWFGTMLIITILITLFINVPLTKMLLHTFYKKK